MEYKNYLSTHYKNLYSSRTAKSRLEWYSRNYADKLGTDQSIRILEIGPGFGEFLGWLDQKGFRNFHAIDLSIEVVAHCNSVWPDSSTLVPNATEYLKLYKGEFDLIVMLHVLEHVPKDQTIDLLVAIRKALTPTGKLIVEIPNMSNPLVGSILRYSDFTHEFGFNDRSLHQVLAMAGFQSIQIHPNKVPLTSLFRIVQAGLIGLSNALLKVLLNFYFPGARYILSTALYAHAS